MKKIILGAVFFDSDLFAGNEFDCRKMNNKKGLGYAAKYGLFYTWI